MAPISCGAALSVLSAPVRNREPDQLPDGPPHQQKKMSSSSLGFSGNIRFTRAFSRVPCPAVHPGLHRPFNCPLSERFSSRDAFNESSTSSCSVRRGKFFPKAVLSETPGRGQFPKVGAQSTGPIPLTQLIQVVETAAKSGAQVFYPLLS